MERQGSAMAGQEPVVVSIDDDPPAMVACGMDRQSASVSQWSISLTEISAGSYHFQMN